MKTKKFKGYTITDAMPKKDDLMICINKNSVNYGTTHVNEMSNKVSAFAVDTKNWKVVVAEPKKLTSLEKHPEFKKLVNKLADDVCIQINKLAPKIKSEMPYKVQFTLEEVIKILESRV